MRYRSRARWLWVAAATYFLIAGHVALPLIPVLINSLPLVLILLRPSNDVMILISSTGAMLWVAIPPIRFFMHVAYYETALFYQGWAKRYVEVRPVASVALKASARVSSAVSALWPNSVSDLVLGAAGVPRRIVYPLLAAGVLLTSVVSWLLGLGLVADLHHFLELVADNVVVIICLALFAGAVLSVTIRDIIRAARRESGRELFSESGLEE